MVKEFEGFLRRKNPRKSFNDARERDAKAFVKHLAKDGRNTFDHLIGLLRYSRFSGNRDTELALIILLDQGSILETMAKNLKSAHGKKKHDEVLKGFKAPPIGTSPKKMPKITTEFLDRLESSLGQEATRAILIKSPHAGPPVYYADERKLLKASKNVDEYLRKRREKFIRELRGHMENGSLFFNQPIDQDVIDFVESNPEVAGGIRKGNKIYCSKIPYMAIEYLGEKDTRMKRYYLCHCPLARESILTGTEMSRNLCVCSAGFEKAPFDVAFGKPLKIEVLKSALWGDVVCRFALEIPSRHRTR